MVTPDVDGNVKQNTKAVKNNKRQQTLKRTLFRVVVCLVGVHVMFLVSGVFHVLVNEPQEWGYGSRKIYRSLYCACSVLMIVSMQMTYKDWRKRMLPWCGVCQCFRSNIDVEQLELPPSSNSEQQPLADDNN